MKLTVQIKLLPTTEQHLALKETMETFNDACNYISRRAFDSKVFRQVNLHHLVYYDTRTAFPSLSSQFIIRAIAKTADSYQLQRKTQCRFGKHSAVVYDQRLLSFRRLTLCSINSVRGRQKIPIIIGNYRKLGKERMAGQADLIFRRNKFFLYLVIEFPEGTVFNPKGVLGIDMGITNITVTSDGEFFSGQQIDKIRKRRTKFRAKLQHCGSKSAKQHLKKYSGKERRFKRHTNHVISKVIVSNALKTQRAIALEDLKGFRPTVRKAQREIFGKWAFGELRRFMEYKAALAGVPVILVNPQYTSQTCSACGHISKSNRKSQAIFSCTSCGEALNADQNAARNIGRLGAVNHLSSISVHLPSTIAPPSGTESPGL